MDKREIFKQKFIERAKEKYKDYNYDYSQVVYKSATDKVKIICPVHGEYEQTPAKFMEGRICPECRGLKRKTYYTTEIFIEKAKSIHPEYDYSETEYVEYNTKLKVICPEHGEFYITPGHLLIGEENVIRKDHIVLRGKEIDFYLPKYKIGIEYDGVYWHSEVYKDKDYHLNKTLECELSFSENS